jgi:DNA adenine methylase
MVSPSQVTNVASVPNRSPFRYAGGKTWFVPHTRKWLSSFKSKPIEFIEPFLGGGITSLTVAFERLSQHITMIELDDEVAAVWEVIINGDAEKLANRIVEFEFNINNVKHIIGGNFSNPDDIAFKTIVKNRATRGGILAGGVGLIKDGEKGKGLASRWYPETLKRRILDISRIRYDISFFKGDGLKVMLQHAHNADAVFFIDPPYTAPGKSAGSRLYTHSQIDHECLFEIAQGLRGDFIMTYDNEPGAIELARRHNFDIEKVAMKNTHHAKMTELVIGRNLDWLRSNKPPVQLSLDL